MERINRELEKCPRTAGRGTDLWMEGAITLYTLKFAEGQHGPAKVLQFEASDLAAVLQLAEAEPLDRRAELWEGSRKLCEIRQTVDGVWKIGP